MTLILSIVKCPTEVSIVNPSKTFAESGGKIGRGAQNDWVLEDPDKYVSLNHCFIDFEGGSYYLTDTSTNGTFVNDSGDPLGKHTRVLLNDGDNIGLGTYEIRAAISMEGKDLPPLGQSVESGALDPLDPFGSPGTDHVLQDRAFAEPAAHNPGPSVGYELDPFASQNPIPNADLLGSGNLDQDPLRALNKATNSHLEDPLSYRPSESLANGMAPDGLQDSPDSIHSSGPIHNSDLVHNSDSVHNSDLVHNNSVSMGDAFHVPSPQQIIPDDFDIDFSSKKPDQPAVETYREPTSSSRSHAADKPVKSFTIPESFELGLNESPINNEPVANTPESSPEPIREQVTPSIPERSQTPVGVENTREAVSNDASLDTLLQGLGLADQGLSKQEVEQIYANIGELLPLIVNGMMQVLRSRASIKNEFRMNSTMIQPAENNPLKFSAEVSEAIQVMFLNNNSSAYLDATDAFQDGFDGICEHQIAIIAGVREAFKSMMTQFDPEKLEEQFNKQNKGVNVPGFQKVKYWTSYVNHYTSLVDNMENSFQFLFGDEFVKAYEAQLCRLALDRKQK